MKTLYFFLMATMLAACSTTMMTSRQGAIDDFNAQADGRTGLIIMTNDSSHLGKDFQLSRGQMFWSAARSGEPRHTPISEIKKVVFVKRGKGAGYGVKIGFVSGLVGVGLAYRSTHSVFGKNIFALISFPVVISGAGTGALFGSAIGFQETYEFQQK